MAKLRLRVKGSGEDFVDWCEHSDKPGRDAIEIANFAEDNNLADGAIVEVEGGDEYRVELTTVPLYLVYRE